MNRNWIKILSATLVSTCIATSVFAADEIKRKAISDASVKPIMDKNSIPGIAVAIAVDGEGDCK
ncbi:class C beta-lactamase, partial [Rhizobium ruizarguesonis]